MIPVSIIVLIYNTEQYIERCVVSLFEQTLHDIEYIFVNDCTSDNSIEVLSEVLERYPERKPYVKIVNHEANKGSATARNTGLDAATGEYVIYADSDDWIELDMLEKLYNKAQQDNADIVWCDFYEEMPHGYKKRKIQAVQQDKISCIKALLVDKMHGSTCNKLVKHSLYTENGLRFFDGLDLWEDLAMTVRQFFYANKVTYLPEAFYHYCYNATSILRDPDEVKQEKRLSDIFGNMSEIVEFLQENKSESVYCKEVNCRKLLAKIVLLNNDPIRWRNAYPEANQYIFSCPTFSWYIKFTEWLCVHGVMWAPRFKNWIATYVKQLLGK